MGFAKAWPCRASSPARAMLYGPYPGGRWAAGFWGEPMAAYRLYLMNGLGKIGRVERLDARNDEEAVSLASARELPVDCEVWDRDRLVAEIPAHGTTPV